MTPNWIDQIESLGVLEVAKRLGMRQIDRGHLSPCPACKGERRSRTDDRAGSVFVVSSGKGWSCGLCGAKGHAIRLAMYALLGELLTKGDPRWRDLKVKAAEVGLCNASRAETWTPPPPPPPEPRQRIDAGELAALWKQSARADEDAELGGWLERRGLDVAAVAERDLCRALPTTDLPRWARFRGAPWSLGWRCLVRAYDAAGNLASIRARWVKPEDPPSGGEKTGAAAGGPGSAGGAVLACGLGQQVLALGKAPDWWPAGQAIRVVVTEGEPDWMSWAIRMQGEYAPAVIGVFNGSWDAEIATRIPDGARLALWTHDDVPGQRYADQIVSSLRHRCRLFRHVPSRVVHVQVA